MRLTQPLVVAALLATLFATAPLGPVRSALAAGCPTDPTGAPDLAGINYHLGSSAGGTSVVFTGCRFTGVTSVHFDTTEAAFTFISDTEVDAISPPHPAGLIMVSLTTPAGSTPTVGNGREDFRYVDYPAGHKCTQAYMTPTNPTQPAGSAFRFFGAAAGCPNPLYAYWIRFLNGKWYLKKAFSSDPTFTWSSSGFPPGAYKVVVWVVQQGHSTAAPEAYWSSWPTLTGCTGVSISPPSGSGARGTPVLFTAGDAVGCPDPLFEFWIQDVLGKWHKMSGFDGDTWTWNNDGWGTGTYHIHVWANQQGAYTGRAQAIGESTYTLT